MEQRKRQLAHGSPSMVARIRAEEIGFGKLPSVDATDSRVAAVRIASGLKRSV